MRDLARRLSVSAAIAPAAALAALLLSCSDAPKDAAPADVLSLDTTAVATLPVAPFA